MVDFPPVELVLSPAKTFTGDRLAPRFPLNSRLSCGPPSSIYLNPRSGADLTNFVTRLSSGDKNRQSALKQFKNHDLRRNKLNTKALDL
jgi:hypothetical protein